MRVRILILSILVTMTWGPNARAGSALDTYLQETWFGGTISIGDACFKDKGDNKREKISEITKEALLSDSSKACVFPATWGDVTNGKIEEKCSKRMLVPLMMNQYGVYLCGVVVAADRASAIKKPYTIYYKDEASNCTWFCRQGQYGEGCASTTVPEQCNTTVYEKSSFGDSTANGENVETAVRMVVANEYKNCKDNGLSYKVERDVIIAAREVISHGARIGLFLVQAGVSAGDFAHNGVALVKEFGDKVVTVCANGYSATYCNDPAGCDGFAYGEEYCQNMCENGGNTVWCDGFKSETERARYNQGEVAESYYDNDGKGCIGYRCSTPGYGFNKSYQCVSCSGSRKFGISEETGECIECKSGMVFNSTLGKCTKATTYNKTDMVYGRGKTKDSSAVLSSQCWTKTTPDEYKMCVVGK